MSSNTHRKLTDYYEEQGIHPMNFKCKHKCFCEKFAHNGQMTEAKMSMVGSEYDKRFPTIVVVSLDPPDGDLRDFPLPEQRTIQHVTAANEIDGYDEVRPNPHWAMTQIIVKDLLCLFGYESQSDAAIVEESYSGRRIDNVTRYFAHVNVAKCSMNNPGRGQANIKVHDICGNSYLRKELEILQPDILITQGEDTNRIMRDLLSMPVTLTQSGVPKSKNIILQGKNVLWMPMPHPTYKGVQLIRENWKSYKSDVKRFIAARRISFRKRELAGSRLRCLMLTSQGRGKVAECLNELIEGYGQVDPSVHLWRPEGFLNGEETQLGRSSPFLTEGQNKTLVDWWLAVDGGNTRLPTWDIVSQAEINGREGLLLVEAKAHFKELGEEDKCGAVNEDNRNRIGYALQEASDALTSLCSTNWNLQRDFLYQLSNRFAWTWKLATMGMPVILVYLGFLNAGEMQDKGCAVFSRYDDWRNALLGYAEGTVPKEAWERRIDVDGTPIYPLIRSMDLRWISEGGAD